MKLQKSTAVAAPSSISDASAMMAEYVSLEREKLLERLAAEDEIDRIKDRRDHRLADLDARAKPLFAALKAWWEAVGRHELAKGRRSAELGGAKIGIRLTPPAVRFRRGIKAGDVVSWLRNLRWARGKDFLRTKVDLDRQAVIKAVQADAQIAETFAAHLTVEQVDEFFIDTGLDEDEIKKALSGA